MNLYSFNKVSWCEGYDNKGQPVVRKAAEENYKYINIVRTISYEEQTYQLGQGDCVFIDCRKAYSHSTSDNLWSLQWCHFYAPSLPAVYEKYKERGGRPVFHPDDIASFTSLLSDLYNLASVQENIGSSGEHRGEHPVFS